MKGIKDMLIGISLMVAAILLHLITNDSIILSLLSAAIGLIFVWLGYKNKD